MTTGSRVAAGSRVVAGVATLGVAAIVAVVSWQDAGLFTWALAGVPLLAVVPMLVLTGRRRRAGLATAAAAVVVLGWALLTGLGTGAFFLAPAGLLLVAAALTAAYAVEYRSSASGPPES